MFLSFVKRYVWIPILIGAFCIIGLILTEYTFSLLVWSILVVLMIISIGIGLYWQRLYWQRRNNQQPKPQSSQSNQLKKPRLRIFNPFKNVSTSDPSGEPKPSVFRKFVQKFTPTRKPKPLKTPIQPINPNTFPNTFPNTLEITKYVLCLKYGFETDNKLLLQVPIGTNFWKQQPIKQIWKETVTNWLLDFNQSSIQLDNVLDMFRKSAEKKINNVYINPTNQNIPLISVETFRIVVQKLVVLWLMGIQSADIESNFEQYSQAFHTHSKHFSSIPQYSDFLKRALKLEPQPLDHQSSLQLAGMFCRLINTEEECLIAKDLVKDPSIIFESWKIFLNTVNITSL